MCIQDKDLKLARIYAVFVSLFPDGQCTCDKHAGRTAEKVCAWTAESLYEPLVPVPTQQASYIARYTDYTYGRGEWGRLGSEKHSRQVSSKPHVKKTLQKNSRVGPGES